MRCWASQQQWDAGNCHQVGARKLPEGSSVLNLIKCLGSKCSGLPQLLPVTTLVVTMTIKRDCGWGGCFWGCYAPIARKWQAEDSKLCSSQSWETGEQYGRLRIVSYFLCSQSQLCLRTQTKLKPWTCKPLSLPYRSEEASFSLHEDLEESPQGEASLSSSPMSMLLLPRWPRLWQAGQWPPKMSTFRSL